MSKPTSTYQIETVKKEGETRKNGQLEREGERLRKRKKEEVRRQEPKKISK